MTSNGWLQIALFGVIVIVITRPFGGYMTRVFAVMDRLEEGVEPIPESLWFAYAR
jgi:K+-transporting ATPase A subunit